MPSDGTAAHTSGELAATSFSGIPAEKIEAQRERCPMLQSWKTNRYIWNQCLTLTIRLAIERSVPKPLQIFLHAAIATMHHYQSRVMCDDRLQKENPDRA